MWQYLPNLLIVLGGLLTGAAVASGVIVPLMPIRWGLIALWFAMFPVGYMLLLFGLMSILDWLE